MQKFLTKYGLAAHLALTAVAPLFLSPTAVIWLAAVAAIWILMEPSCVGSETLHSARMRMNRKLIHDPLFWVLLVAVVFAGIRALNSGVGLAYDAEVRVWSLATPRWPLMPSATDECASDHFALVFALFVVVTGCRQALGRSARFAVTLIAGALAGIGALVALYSYTQGDEWALERATFELVNPTFWGTGFGVYFVFSVLGLAAAFERRWLRAMPLAVIGVFGTSIGAFLFAPPLVAALYGAAGLLVFLYAFVYLKLILGNAAEFKYLVVFGTTLTFATMLVIEVLPESLVIARTAPYLTGEFLEPKFFELRSTLANLSLEVWKTRPWLGSGLGAYSLALPFSATPADWAVLATAPSAPLNGYWFILAERGGIGAFMMAVPFLLLTFTYFRRLVLGVRRLSTPLAWAGLPAIVAAGVETLGDASALASGALLPLTALFALAAQSFSQETHKHG